MNTTNVIQLLHQQNAVVQTRGSRRATNNILRSQAMVQRLEATSWNDAKYPHQGCVNTVQWNSNGSLLISGGDDVTLNIWNFEQRRVVHSIQTSHTGNIFSAKFLPQTGDSKIVSCAADGVICVFDMNWNEDKHQSLHRFTCHNSMTHKFAVEPGNPNIFITSSGDGTCRLFDLRSPFNNQNVLIDWRQVNEGKTVDLNSIDMNPANFNYLIAAGGDPYLRLYDRRMTQYGSTSLACVKQYCPQKVAEKSENQSRYLPIHITGARYNYSGTEFVGTYSGNSIYLFEQNAEGEDSTTGPLVSDYKMEYKGHRNIRTVKEVNFLGPKHEFVLSGSDDGNVFVWDKETGEIVHIAKGDKHIVNCLDLHPVYPLCFASSGIEYDIKVWEPTAEEPMSKEMQNLEKILEDNKKVNQQGHSSLLLPASFVVNLVNLMNDDDSEEEATTTTTTTPTRTREERRRLARLINQLTMMAASDSGEENEEEEGGEGTQCRTQ